LKPERIVVIEPNEFGAGRQARIIKGEVWQLGNGRFFVIERGQVAAPPPLDGETDSIRARVAIKAQLDRAGKTILRSPLPPELRQLVGVVVNWPDMAAVLRDLDKHDRPSPIRPTARDQDELEECLTWLFWLEPAQRSAVWGKMMGFGRRRLRRIDPLKRSKDTIGRDFDKGITEILSRLLAGSGSS